MNTEELENLILLRSTGELTKADAARLDAALADAQLASHAMEFGRMLAFAAPCDFAAEAIASVHAEHAPRDFAAEAIRTVAPTKRRRPIIAWSYAAAAALLLLAASTALWLKPDPVTPASRQTAAISAQLDGIEQALLAPRARTSRALHRPQI